MAVIKITSQNVGFSENYQDADVPACALITSQFPGSINPTPVSFCVRSEAVIDNFTPGQKTYIYLTSSTDDVAAIEGAVSVLLASTECV